VNDGGGGRIYDEPPGNLEEQLEEAERRTQRRQLASDINSGLRDVLRELNDRDVESVRDRLDSIQDLLGDAAELETLIFGGSVAKHTYVDGLSDIDALVILDREFARGSNPKEILRKFREILHDNLKGRKIQDIRSGDLAVTVTYSDGMEIQLLPAIRVGTKLAIRGEGGRNWTAIDPGAFRKTLTDANRKLSNQLIPAIKLIKSMVSSFPSQKKLTGYHIEALSLAAAKDYSGSTTLKDLVSGILSRGATLVLNSIRDVTGQSRSVDAYLGPAGSVKRQIAADALQSAARQLESAGSAGEWINLVGG